MDLTGLQGLRRALAERRRGRGIRVSDALRARVAAHAQRRRRRGESARAIAEDLGLSYETIRRWTMYADAAAPVPVAIVAESPPAARTLSVVSPTGYRVDGLSLDETAALLRALA